MTDRLARLTPNAAGLDRDALLFAAGQRSARTSRFWPALAGALAIAQVATIFCLWPREPAPSTGAAPLAVDLSSFELPAVSPPTDIWSAGSQPDVLQTTSSPTKSEFVSTGPTLTVGSAGQFD